MSISRFAIGADELHVHQDTASRGFPGFCEISDDTNQPGHLCKDSARQTEVNAGPHTHLDRAILFAPFSEFCQPAPRIYAMDQTYGSMKWHSSVDIVQPPEQMWISNSRQLDFMIRLDWVQTDQAAILAFKEAMGCLSSLSYHQIHDASDGTLLFGASAYLDKLTYVEPARHYSCIAALAKVARLSLAENGMHLSPLLNPEQLDRMIYALSMDMSIHSYFRSEPQTSHWVAGLRLGIHDFFNPLGFARKKDAEWSIKVVAYTEMRFPMLIWPAEVRPVSINFKDFCENRGCSIPSLVKWPSWDARSRGPSLAVDHARFKIFFDDKIFAGSATIYDNWQTAADSLEAEAMEWLSLNLGGNVEQSTRAGAVHRTTHPFRIEKSGWKRVSYKCKRTNRARQPIAPAVHSAYESWELPNAYDPPLPGERIVSTRPGEAPFTIGAGSQRTQANAVPLGKRRILGVARALDQGTPSDVSSDASQSLSLLDPGSMHADRLQILQAGPVPHPKSGSSRASCNLSQTCLGRLQDSQADSSSNIDETDLRALFGVVPIGTDNEHSDRGVSFDRYTVQLDTMHGSAEEKPPRGRCSREMFCEQHAETEKLQDMVAKAHEYQSVQATTENRASKHLRDFAKSIMPHPSPATVDIKHLTQRSHISWAGNNVRTLRNSRALLQDLQTGGRRMRMSKAFLEDEHLCRLTATSKEVVGE